MAVEKSRQKQVESVGASSSSPVDELLIAALARGGESLETGRYLVTFKEGAAAENQQMLEGRGLRVANALDFDQQAFSLGAVGDADSVVFPEIGVALVGGGPAQAHGLMAFGEASTDSPVESIDPEYFMFVHGAAQYAAGLAAEERSSPSEYLRGFMRAAEVISQDLLGSQREPALQPEEEVLALGATWGLNACRVPQSSRSGAGIKVAVLDTGMDLLHPDFGGRTILSQSFVGQPVQDLHGHGTHCIGTACGALAPPGSTPRYGVAHKSTIFAGKVLSNSGSGTQAGILAGINWAIANGCQVISMSLGAPVSTPHPAYTAAGQSALNRGILIVAAAGNESSLTGAPANSPTIMSVASLDSNLRPSSFSNFGKVEIAGPGRDVFSSWPRPLRYKTISGTSMATPHVAGCAALWAQTSSSLRGRELWRKLQRSARPLPLPASRVGSGLVQAP